MSKEAITVAIVFVTAFGAWKTSYAQTENSAIKDMKPPQIKLLNNHPATVRVWETAQKNTLRIVISIGTGKGKHVRYEDVKIKAFDTSGARIPPSKHAEHVHFMDVSGTQTGVFEVTTTERQAIARVEVKFGDFVETYTVEEVLKPVKGPE